MITQTVTKEKNKHSQVLYKGKENTLKNAVLRHSTHHENKRSKQDFESTLPTNMTHG